LQLRKLQLVGFKTFADKTEVHIDPGLTAVVGPNGSGKSNIVDALLWVLGEQNPRMLRGSSAQDVIFAGTSRRKPLGMAEVKLTIDNSDHVLPIDFAEVTVTRRVYRSGESQYLLNGAACRLRDIVDLFLDTGVGKDAYAFVSQQEIDSVLSARPEDRRELFEEAAGIKKYRSRKREALRKLESAEANLTRVRDILLELETQREPMERQATLARRYVQLQERLHEIEVELLVSEIKRADYELFACRQNREESQAALLKLDAETVRLERIAEEAAKRLAELDVEMEAVRQAHQAAVSQLERHESRLALISEREISAERAREQLTSELADLTFRIEKLRDEVTIDSEDLDAVQRDEAAGRESWTAAQAALKELETAASQARRDLEARQGERLRLAKERAGREAALNALSDRLTETEGRYARLREELQKLAVLVEQAEVRSVEAGARRAECATERERLGSERGAAEAGRRELQAALASSRTALETTRRTLAERTARLNTLTELQENHEGFYQGVRAVLNAHRKGQIKGAYKAVVDLLTVPEHLRIAIEVALGGSLQDIVTETEAEAKAAIEWLKQTRSGRATFLPLPLLRPGSGLSMPAQGDLLGVASDLVTFDARYRPVAQLLLGRVLVVEDMDAALAASRRLNGWSKIVTLGGELLSPGGALTGGSLQGKGAHLLGRKGEIDDLKSEIPRLREEVAGLTARQEETAQSLQAAEQQCAQLAQAESEAAAALVSAESALRSAEREVERTGRDLADRRASEQAMQSQVEALRSQCEKLQAELLASAQDDATTDDALAALQERLEALLARRDTYRREAVALEVEVGRLRERREGLTRSLAANRQTLEGLETQQRQRTERQSEAETDQTDAREEKTRLGELQREAAEHLQRIERDVEAWRERRLTLSTESTLAAAAVKAALHSRGGVTAELHAADLGVARLEVQIVQAAERLRDEYGISREEALARPDGKAPDRHTSIEVSRLRREIRAMGPVNTGAIAEYERLTERYEFLSGQQQDLDKSRESLLATIAEIDDSTRGVFMETFDAVRVEFDRLFVRLFEGGSTQLLLTNPNDLLETGIEIIAQPPGKKAQSLALLSGGERALTATALIFAFLAVKPSPFVLLDEVDAPLDGANVEKFSQLVKEFSARSQFLLITHNPTTMEAAPTWYGITMREPGISSVLSYRVPQESAALPAEEAVASVGPAS
jgi:chromosome segregation protein